MVNDLDNTDYGLAEIHSKLLETLSKFDSICRENGIFYSLHGGTLLGAERNGAFIPWDDDVDISMTRKNFEAFKKVMRGGIDGYIISDDELWVPRFTRKNQEDPVCLDILVWDYISEKKIAQKLKITCLRALQGMMKEDVDYSLYGLKGKILVGATQIMGKLLSRKKKREIFYRVQTRRWTGAKKYIHRSNDSYRGCSYILDSHYMDEYSDIRFEGRAFMVNKRYREFLVMEYGKNYMTPPPVKDRHPGHVLIRESLGRKQKPAADRKEQYE